MLFEIEMVKFSVRGKYRLKRNLRKKGNIHFRKHAHELKETESHREG